MARLSESDIESAALAWLEALGYTILSGPDIAPGEPAAEPARSPSTSVLGGQWSRMFILVELYKVA